MSLRDRPGPGVQGFHFIYCHSRVYLCPTDTPQNLDRDHCGSPGAPDDILEGLKEAWEQGWWVGAQPPAPTPGTLLPRRTTNLWSLGDHSDDCRCHQEV